MIRLFLFLIVLGLATGGAAPVAAQSQSHPTLRDVFATDASLAPTASVVEKAATGTESTTGLIPDAWRPRSTELNWIDYSILAATGAAAVLAIRYKFEADDLYEEYQASGDPALRPRIKTLDTRSGIATGAMQVGVLSFGVRLLLR